MPTSPRTNVLAVLLTLCFVLVAGGKAQGQTVVTPDGGTATADAQGSGEVTFTVENPDPVTWTFDFTCSFSGAVTSCTTFPTSATLASGGSTTVSVSFSTGAAGAGTVSLFAEPRPDPNCDPCFPASGDGGWYNVTVIAPTLGAPSVALRNHNRDNRDRSLCLTTGGSEGAAWQCGDLLVAHSMPGYATMGRQRLLTLLYNSAQAAPRPAVAAVVNQTGLTAPDSVYAELTVNGVAQASAMYPWGAGASVRQIVLAYDATAEVSGVYPFTLTVRNFYGSETWEAPVLQDTLLVVNRSLSEFGQGWWLAGVEQLVLGQPNGAILWLGGDGSAKLYRSAGANTWVAPAGGFRDTLRLDTGTGVYTRTLRHGIQVRFDGAGRHIETVNRVGQKTTFTWTGSPARLTSIQVPPQGVAGTTYSAAYDLNGKLDYLRDPAGRTLDVTVSGGLVSAMTDPDGFGPSFGYNAAGQMTSRVSRRGFAATFQYLNGVRVTQISQPPSGARIRAVTNFEPWDEKGLAIGLGQTGRIAVDTALAQTKILGPRTNVADDATFWVDRWGAPVKIVDPIGATTVIGRGDPALPALVTQVTYPNAQTGAPNGRIVKMTWSARGNLVETRDSTYHLDGRATAVSGWTYNSANTKDSPDQVIDPDSVTTRFAYNTMGLTSHVTAPNGHITQFEYHTTDSLKGVLRAVVEQDVFVYDSALSTEVLADPRISFAQNALGNDTSVTSPMGHVTRYVRDSAQRVRDVYDPLGHRVEFHADALNRRTLQIVHDAEALYTPRADTTRYHYAVDVLDSIIDPRGVVRRFEYDDFNRPVREIDDFDHVQERKFDEAGLVTDVRPRYFLSFPAIRHTYDKAGRRLKVAWPARGDVAADSILYTYDVIGQILTATTSLRRVEREYFANGLLKQEVQSNSDGTGRITHRYGYDRAGRRTFYRVGSDASNDSTWYRYDALSGDLTVIGVRWRDATRDSVTFKWDALGRRDTLKYTNGTVVDFAYDVDGRFRRLCSKHTSTSAFPPNPDVFKARVAHTWVNPDGLVRTLQTFGAGDPDCPESNSTLQYTQENTFDFKHQLTTYDLSPGSQFTYTYDASGNLTRREPSIGVARIFEVPAGHNMLGRSISADDTRDYVAFTYDGAGARLVEQYYVDDQIADSVRRDYLYDGLGRVSGTIEPGPGGFRWGSAGMCRYDPLGRMFDPCENLGPLLGFDGHNVTRTGADGQDFTWTFVHGPGLDDPLMAFRDGNAPNECTERLYWITDGQGREYGRGNPEGYDCSPDPATSPVAQLDANFAGTITRARSFDATRYPSASMADISFFRNRFYDQATGRWTQEDPIGVAGGLNLYSYVGNNPASYTDPFGLFFPFIGAVAGFLAIGAAEVAAGATVWAALGTAATVMGATALGSAAAAGVESAVTGAPFLGAFERNFSIAGGFLAASVLAAATIGGGYAGAGANNILQGYVQSQQPIAFPGALTLGPGTAVSGPIEVPGLLAHELGHAIQLVGLSALTGITGQWFPLGPWIPYGVLGGLGLTPLGGWWENSATWLGTNVR